MRVVKQRVGLATVMFIFVQTPRKAESEETAHNSPTKIRNSLNFSVISKQI